MKCTCLIVEEKRSGKKLPGTGTTADPYQIEKHPIACLVHGNGSKLQINTSGSVTLPKAVGYLNYGGNDYQPDGGIMYWDDPVNRFEIHQETENPDGTKPHINIERYQPNEVLLTDKDAINDVMYMNQSSYTPVDSGYRVSMGETYMDSPVITGGIAKAWPISQEAWLGTIPTGSTQYQTFSYEVVPERTLDIPIFIEFVLSDINNSNPATTGLGDSVPFILALQLKPRTSSGQPIYEYDENWLNVADGFFSFRNIRRNYQQFKFMKKIRLEAGENYDIVAKLQVTKPSYLSYRTIEMKRLRLTGMLFS